MVCYLHHVTMNNGETFDLLYVDKMLDWKELSKEKWLPYENSGRGYVRYINIAQISDIYIKAIDPVRRDD